MKKSRVRYSNSDVESNSKIVSANTLNEVLKIPDYLPKPEWE